MASPKGGGATVEWLRVHDGAVRPGLRITRRFARRATLRAVLAGGAAAGVSRLVGHARGKPSPAVVAAGGAALGATALELPIALPAVGVGAALLADRAVRRGHDPVVVAVAAVAGVAAGLATRFWWPVASHARAELRQPLHRAKAEPASGGAGVVVVVNPDAGPALSRNPTELLADALPDAEVIEVDENTSLLDALRRAADGAKAIGVAGGDGSVNAGAVAALDFGKPLMIIPAGTLNHLARDLGLATIDDVVEAVQHGNVGAMDVGELDLGNGESRIFLNTASFGSYAELVDARERLEGSIGKWPALVVALIKVLRGSSPIDVEIDGRRRRLWMIFIGNCHYHPSGFAPSWREHLDDGQLDVRLVDGTQPWARLRLVVAVLTGTLHRSHVYEQFSTDQLRVHSLDGAMRLASDGETFDGPPTFEVRKRPDRLTVYVLDRSD